MRVRCERLLAIAGESRGNEVDSYPGDWIRKGDEYLVLQVRVDASPPRGIMPTSFLIFKELQGPVWAPAALFSVVSAALPSNWSAEIDEDGELKLGPQPWLERDFWTEYHGEHGAERTAEARAQFERELAVIVTDDASERRKS